MRGPSVNVGFNPLGTFETAHIIEAMKLNKVRKLRLENTCSAYSGGKKICNMFLNCQSVLQEQKCAVYDKKQAKSESEYSDGISTQKKSTAK